MVPCAFVSPVKSLILPSQVDINRYRLTGGYHTNVYQFDMSQIYWKLLNGVLNKEIYYLHYCKKVQVGKDQEKAQSEKDSRSRNRDGKKLN